MPTIDHYECMQRGNKLYAKRKYKYALKWYRRAYLSMSECPLTQWYVATCYTMLKDYSRAAKIFMNIINTKYNRHLECFESVEWFRKLKTDCYFWTAICLHKGGFDGAASFMVEYINLYKPFSDSVAARHGRLGSYSLKRALRELKKMCNKTHQILEMNDSDILNLVMKPLIAI